MRVEAAAWGDVLWLTDRTGVIGTPRLRAIKATDTAGAIRGMVAYDEWTPASCQVHMAADTPIAWRSLLRPAFSYPFEEVGVRVLLGVIPASNTRALTMVRHFGFTLEHVIRDGFSEGVHLCLFEMRREACRWLSPEGKN